MKNKLFIAFLPFLLFFSHQNSKQEYSRIKLEYSGYSDKPYPVIIFYPPNYVDIIRDGSYADKFNVTKKEFISIAKVIEDNKVDSAPYCPDAYEFSITRKGEKKSISTRSIAAIRSVFNNILSRVNNIDKRNAVKERMQTAMRRLGYEL